MFDLKDHKVLQIWMHQIHMLFERQDRLEYPTSSTNLT